MGRNVSGKDSDMNNCRKILIDVLTDRSSNVIFDKRDISTRIVYVLQVNCHNLLPYLPTKLLIYHLLSYVFSTMSSFYYKRMRFQMEPRTSCMTTQARRLGEKIHLYLSFKKVLILHSILYKEDRIVLVIERLSIQMGRERSVINRNLLHTRDLTTQKPSTEEKGYLSAICTGVVHQTCSVCTYSFPCRIPVVPYLRFKTHFLFHTPNP